MMFKKGPSEAEKELKKEQQHVAELERKVGQLTYEVDWLKKNLEKAVASLPWEYRVAIVLRHIQDYSYKEIASTMELPLNTVKTRIHRGRMMLRDILGPLLEQRSDNR
jgi:RNA polymerase sigma factor (sigma-70 family)